MKRHTLRRRYGRASDAGWNRAVEAGRALKFGRPTFVRFKAYPTLAARDKAIAALKAIGVPVEIVRR